jgi:5,10-methenyltetrahydromethanopterin hydrogenase
VRLSHDAVAALAAYKSARGLLSFEDTVTALLGAVHQEAQ